MKTIDPGDRRCGRLAGAAFCCALLLAGCGGLDPSADADLLQELRAETSYFPDNAPPSATLLLSEHKGGSGAVHAALVITGSERVIYDPSGSFTHPDTRRLGDVVYGASDPVVEMFALHNADKDHDAMMRRIPLSAEEAEQMLARARSRGGAMPGYCAKSVADVMRAAPRFAAMRDTFWPSNVLEDFVQFGPVETRVVSDTDSFTARDEN
jgi:hypothetical protein